MELEGDFQNLRMINGRFKTTSGHFFGIYMNIFHKTEVQVVILIWLTGLNPNFFMTYDTKCKYFHFHFFAIL